MNTMTKSDYKLQVFKEIMLVENELVLKQVYKMVHDFLADYKELPVESLKGGKISFEEWNKQFIDNKDLDVFIPEYGSTLREFRKSIYESEMNNDEMSINEFKESMKTWL